VRRAALNFVDERKEVRGSVTTCINFHMRARTLFPPCLAYALAH